MNRYDLKPHTYLTQEPGAASDIYKLRVIIPIPAGYEVESQEPTEDPADSFPPGEMDEFRTIIIKVREASSSTSQVDWVYTSKRGAAEAYIVVKVCQGSCNGSDEKGVRKTYYDHADNQVIGHYQPHLYLTKKTGETKHTLICIIPCDTDRKIDPNPPVWPATRPGDGIWKAKAVIKSATSTAKHILYSQLEDFQMGDIINIEVENGGIKGKGIVRAKDSDNKPWR